MQLTQKAARLIGDGSLPAPRGRKIVKENGFHLLDEK
jgi:hypothetical protein